MPVIDAARVSGEPSARIEPVAAPCEVCGSIQRSLRIGGATDYVTGHAFDVAQCRGCGLANTEPPLASLDAYYPARYRRYGRLTQSVLRSLYRWKVAGWARRIPRKGRALEVGCGDGWMLRALRERGWRVVGSERSIGPARTAAAVNHIPTFVGELTALGGRPRFDLIILFQALEHLEEPVTTLRQGAHLLAPGGMIVAAVPNFDSWQAQLFGRSWFHLDVPRHRHHFSPRALRRAFEQVGLRVIRTRFVSFEHDPYGWVQSTLNSLGFRQNRLTRLLMGITAGDGSRLTALPMIVVGGLLAPIALFLSLCSWAAGAGAIVEMWAINTDRGTQR